MCVDIVQYLHWRFHRIVQLLFSAPELREGLLFHIFNDFYQTNCLNIYRTHLHQICRVSITMTVDKRPKVSFGTLEGRCRGNQFLSVLSTSIHRIGFACHSLDGGTRTRSASGYYIFIFVKDLRFDLRFHRERFEI